MQPIIYRGTVAVRFSDLDPYGHVNSAHYLDYVISSRFRFAELELGVTGKSLVDRGVGFFLAQAETRFHRPIVGVQDIQVSSWVESIDGPALHVPYEVRLADEALVNSGKLRFVVIDLASMKPLPCPDWVRRLFQTE